jgi:hypothetical protein
MEAITAGVSVMGAGVASVLPETDQLDALAKWPLVLILAAVAVISIYLMYRGNRDNSKDRLEEAKMHKDSIEGLARLHKESVDVLAKAVMESGNAMKTELLANSKELGEQKALLAQRPCIRDPKND